MIQAIVFLPLLAAIVAGLGNRMLGNLAAKLITTGALFVSMFLPWYTRSVPRGGSNVKDDFNAFQVFSWVEAAVLLVAAAVLWLLYARSQKRGFHLPGGDGTATSTIHKTACRIGRDRLGRTHTRATRTCRYSVRQGGTGARRDRKGKC